MKKLLLPALLVLLVAGLPLAAQAQPAGPPPGAGAGPGAGPGGPGGPGGPPPDAVLREILGFSDTQLASLRTLQETRQQAVSALIPQIGEAERALHELLQGTSPDAAAVGAALLKVQSLQKQVAAAEETYRNGFKALLTAEQSARIETFRGVETALAAMQALHKLGL